MPYKSKEAKREQNRRYYREHKETIKSNVAKYRQENKERISEYNKKHRQENKELYKERDAAYYQRNRKRIRRRANEYTAAHTKENRARAAKWYEENKERALANAAINGHRRRARIAKVGGAFTKEDIRDLYSTQGARCYYCSTSIESGYHIEHMTPICRGGTNGPENLCLACSPCNRSKATKTVEEFMNVC